MKKTIAIAALLVSSSSALAMPIFPGRDGAGEVKLPELQRYCLKTYKASDKSVKLGCDESRNNVRLERTLKANGCAAGQAALETFEVLAIDSCLPPGFAQL